MIIIYAGLNNLQQSFTHLNAAFFETLKKVDYFIYLTDDSNILFYINTQLNELCKNCIFLVCPILQTQHIISDRENSVIDEFRNSVTMCER